MNDVSEATDAVSEPTRRTILGFDLSPSALSKSEELATDWPTVRFDRRKVSRASTVEVTGGTAGDVRSWAVPSQATSLESLQKPKQLTVRTDA